MIDNGRYLIDEDMPLFLIDFYKHGHVFQYLKGLTRIWVNFTPRSTRVEGETGVVFFGLQRFIKKVLIKEFDEHFFSRPWAAIEHDGRVEAIFKDPITDNAHKKSHRGIPVVYRDHLGRLYLEESLNPQDLDHCSFRSVFDGQLLVDDSFAVVRMRARS